MASRSVGMVLTRIPPSDTTVMFTLYFWHHKSTGARKQKQGFKQARARARKHASNQGVKQARREKREHAIKQESKQAREQARKQRKTGARNQASTQARWKSSKASAQAGEHTRPGYPPQPERRIAPGLPLGKTAQTSLGS